MDAINRKSWASSRAKGIVSLWVIATLNLGFCWIGPRPCLTLADPVDSVSPQEFNVVLILVDDLGWRDLHCTGSEFYESPNLDRLSARSVRFTQGYAACQVCSPSRVAIMTGKFPARLQTTDYFGAPSGAAWKRNTRLLPAEYKQSLPTTEFTLAEAFQTQGYKTFFAGKWHMGGEGSMPGDHGFDINVGGSHYGMPPNGFFAPYKNAHLSDGPNGESLTLRLGQETAKFIEQHSDQKFFAMLSFYSVHSPVQTTQALWKKYRDKASNQRERLTDSSVQRFVIDRTIQPVRQVQDHPIYGGMIETMDQAVGTVLSQLVESKIDDRTIVVFTSDNGGVSAGDASSTSNLPLRGGKGRQWEGGIREPFFLAIPSASNLSGSAQTVPAFDCSTPVISTDIYPTLLELCGLPLQRAQHLDGVSLLPLLQQQPIPPRNLFWHYPHYGNQGGEPCSMIRSGNKKLIYYYEDQRCELYDVVNDPGEQTDLAPTESDLCDRLKQELMNWLDQIDANLPSQNLAFDPSSADRAMDQLRATGLPRLERQHAAFLEENFQPNPKLPGGGWWDQAID